MTGCWSSASPCPALREASHGDLGARGLTAGAGAGRRRPALDLGFFRVGGEEYAAENGTSGWRPSAGSR